MDNNKLIQIEIPPPQVLEYLKKRPDTDFKCWQNALPDDPSGERRSTYVNWIRVNRDPEWTVDTSALAAWEYVWKMFKKRLEDTYWRHRDEIKRLEDRLLSGRWDRSQLIGER